MSMPNPLSMRLTTLSVQLVSFSEALLRAAQELDAVSPRPEWSRLAALVEARGRARELVVVWVGKGPEPSADSSAPIWLGRDGAQVTDLRTWPEGSGLLAVSDGAALLGSTQAFATLVWRAALVVLCEPSPAEAETWQAELGGWGVPLVQTGGEGWTPAPGLPVWRIPEIAGQSMHAAVISAMPDPVQQTLSLRAYSDQLHHLGRSLVERIELELNRVETRLNLLTGPRGAENDPVEAAHRKEVLAQLKSAATERSKLIRAELEERFTENEIEFLPALREHIDDLKHDARSGHLDLRIPPSFLDRIGLAKTSRVLGGQYKVKLRLSLDQRQRLRESAAEIMRKRLRSQGKWLEEALQAQFTELEAQSAVLGIAVPERPGIPSPDARDPAINRALTAKYDLQASQLEFDVERTGFFGAIMRARVAATSLLMMAMMVSSGIFGARPAFQQVAWATLIMLGLLMIWRWITRPIEEDEIRRSRLEDLKLRLEDQLSKAAWDAMKKRFDELAETLEGYVQRWRSAIEQEEKDSGAMLPGAASRVLIEQTEQRILERLKAAIKPIMINPKTQAELRSVSADALRQLTGGRP
jgi:HAMP domain-containing protein